ncbi:MAG: hypothetical protein JNJ60_24035 [Rhodocyclaceae bacterium]|nr:hypothetical protein [Rhodocyclaceae bacterium]
MKVNRSRLALFGVALAGALGIAACASLSSYRTACGSGAGNVQDEAKCVGRMAESFPAADEDYFADMDYGFSKNPQAVAAELAPFLPGITPAQALDAVVKGRNNWIVWTGGNDRLWDQLTVDSVGLLDFLKILSNHPALGYSRDNRWRYMGVVNEPCFEKGGGPRADRYGLWLDVRSNNCPADPFENETKYPGVKIGARGTTVPVGSYYGYATGVVGLRLFPNPDFDEAAAKRWDPERFYTDPKYYNDKKLVRPYRVGMTCGFCHVGPNPTNPPKDPEHPQWANLNSNPGAQYFWVDRVLVWKPDLTGYPSHLFATSRPGALDTSFVSTDYINNPRTMNAVYSLAARLELARSLGHEKLAEGSLDNDQLNKFVPADTPLTRFFKAPDTVYTPRVLKDGSDSVGALGALNRVYVNIGLFSEEWTEHFRPFIGGSQFTPFPIKTAAKNSSYWNANLQQTPNVALFFLASAKPDYLKNAPGGDSHLSKDAAQVTRGKEVFAERCARCHSSKMPEQTASYFPSEGCVGPDYLKCWNKYWDWTKTGDFKQAMTRIVKAPDFLHNNLLSNELRVPVTLLETNACASLATNALRGDIWDNFSSESYKNLPSVGSITVHHPLSGAPLKYEMPAGGRGYIRPASLISLWSTGPYLLNNTLGTFYWSGSVDDRMKSFQSGIEQLLWPDKREGNRQFVTASGKMLPGKIDVTDRQTYLRVPKGYLPGFLKPLVGPLASLDPNIFSEDGLEIGPIPTGTPINLLSNVDLSQRDKVLKLALKAKSDLSSMPKDATDEQARKAFADLVQPLLDLSKCPDFVVNRGHYFGTDYFSEEPGLADRDKRALIEFLKTL